MQGTIDRIAPAATGWTGLAFTAADKCDAFDRDYFRDNVTEFLLDLQTGEPKATPGAVVSFYNLASLIESSGYAPEEFHDRVKTHTRFEAAPFAAACRTFVTKWDAAREAFAAKESR